MIPNETMSTPTYPLLPPDPEVAFAEAIAAFDSGTVLAENVRALSDLTRGRASVLRRAWTEWSVELRRDLSREMEALGRSNVDLLFGRAFRIALDDDDPIVRQTAIAGLWEDTGDDVRERLLLLASEDPSSEVRAEAVRGLGRFAEFAVEVDPDLDSVIALRETLTQLVVDDAESDDVRIRAIESLGVFRDAMSVQLIRDAFDSDDPALMTAAVAAMGRSRSTRWLDSVAEALEEDDTELRQTAATACGLLAEPLLVVELAKAAIDPEHEVRIAALDALAMIGGKAATRVLETAAGDEDYPDRDAAEAALIAMADDSMLA